MKLDNFSPIASATPPIPDFGTHLPLADLNQSMQVKGYGLVDLRPIRPDDEAEMVRFHERISDESIHMRYFQYLGLDRRTTHDRLVRICTNSPQSYAVVMEVAADSQGPTSILAVGRLTQTAEAFTATFDTLIVDEKAPTKLGEVLLRRLVTLARAFGFVNLTGEFLVADHVTLGLCRAEGFSLHTLPENGLVQVYLHL